MPIEELKKKPKRLKIEKIQLLGLALVEMELAPKVVDSLKLGPQMIELEALKLELRLIRLEEQMFGFRLIEFEEFKLVLKRILYG